MVSGGGARGAAGGGAYVSELTPAEIERIIRAAFVEAMVEDAVAEHEPLVAHLVAGALHDAEVEQARAALPIPPGIDELTERLRELFPEATHFDYGERARLEQAPRDSPNARLVERPGKGSGVRFLRSAEEVEAVKNARRRP